MVLFSIAAQADVKMYNHFLLISKHWSTEVTAFATQKQFLDIFRRLYPPHVDISRTFSAHVMLAVRGGRYSCE